jgi:hypothetical protein
MVPQYTPVPAPEHSVFPGQAVTKNARALPVIPANSAMIRPLAFKNALSNRGIPGATA